MQSFLLSFHSVWGMSDQPWYESIHRSRTLLQVVLNLLWTNHYPFRRWSLCLKLNTVQFPAYLITRCSNFLVIWRHALVVAYVPTAVPQHKLQWSLARITGFSYTLCSSLHRRTSLSFAFSVFHLSICPSWRGVSEAFSGRKIHPVTELKPPDL